MMRQMRMIRSIDDAFKEATDNLTNESTDLRSETINANTDDGTDHADAKIETIEITDARYMTIDDTNKATDARAEAFGDTNKATDATIDALKEANDYDATDYSRNATFDDDNKATYARKDYWGCYR